MCTAHNARRTARRTDALQARYGRLNEKNSFSRLARHIQPKRTAPSRGKVYPKHAYGRARAIPGKVQSRRRGPFPNLAGEGSCSRRRRGPFWPAAENDIAGAARPTRPTAPGVIVGALQRGDTRAPCRALLSEIRPFKRIRPPYLGTSTLVEGARTDLPRESGCKCAGGGAFPDLGKKFWRGPGGPVSFFRMGAPLSSGALAPTTRKRLGGYSGRATTWWRAFPAQAACKREPPVLAKKTHFSRQHRTSGAI